VPLVCDTGPLLAGLDRDDPDHARCAQLLTEAPEDLVVPTLVLAELGYWCRKLRLDGAWLAFLAGAWRIEHPNAVDLRRARALQAQDRDFDLGVVDASVLALVERLGEPKVTTLDHRTSPPSASTTSPRSPCFRDASMRV